MDRPQEMKRQTTSWSLFRDSKAAPYGEAGSRKAAKTVGVLAEHEPLDLIFRKERC